MANMASTLESLLNKLPYYKWNAIYNDFLKSRLTATCVNVDNEVTESAPVCRISVIQEALRQLKSSQKSLQKEFVNVLNKYLNSSIDDERRLIELLEYFLDVDNRELTTFDHKQPHTEETAPLLQQQRDNDASAGLINSGFRNPFCDDEQPALQKRGQNTQYGVHGSDLVRSHFL